MIFTYQAMFTSCGNAWKFNDAKVIILDKTEEELRKVVSIKSETQNDAWVGKYILAGKAFPDRAEKTVLGSVNRQYCKITEKVFDREKGKYVNITVPNNAIYAVPSYTNIPLYVSGIELFELDVKCVQVEKDGNDAFEFDLSDTEIRGALEEKLGESYDWETFNKFEIQFVEEWEEEFFEVNHKAFCRSAKAIWSTEYKGVPVENKLEVTLQFADVDLEKGIVFRKNTSVVEIEYTNAFLYPTWIGEDGDWHKTKIDIPTEETLSKLFYNALRYVPGFTCEGVDFSMGMQITSYEGYPCIYCPVIIDEGTHIPNKVVSMIIFI